MSIYWLNISSAIKCTELGCFDNNNVDDITKIAINGYKINIISKEIGNLVNLTKFFIIITNNNSNWGVNWKGLLLIR
ncbi:hypothetical protein BCR32DRAFT_280224 [Anaeromyces robustus]|uniref:Uncharacterized protein n=1 Tax=Anaeromyces robustus TaxID=1754192 RepID=A0A1Y1X653_9FUNG|nr:hypothetical protein BCR32DRAFT_280224 [Anaeromyces robustus]|eukprot:ORX80784.1 hypothetical protein BCR32DRAFT_280224 [Anaeromyces robustus]